MQFKGLLVTAFVILSLTFLVSATPVHWYNVTSGSSDVKVREDASNFWERPYVLRYDVASASSGVKVREHASNAWLWVPRDSNGPHRRSGGDRDPKFSNTQGPPSNLAHISRENSKPDDLDPDAHHKRGNGKPDYDSSTHHKRENRKPDGQPVNYEDWMEYVD